MLNPNEFDAVIFDLGGVLLNLDPEASIRAFQKKVPHFSESGFNGKPDQAKLFNDYEMGLSSSETFLSEFNRIHQASLTMEELKAAWNAMILDFPRENIELLLKLRSLNKKLYLLSNTNEIHEACFLESFRSLNHDEPFHLLFEKVYYSHRIQLRKPNAPIFELVLNQNGLKPNRTVFIDDYPQHIESARSLGIHAIHLKKPMKAQEVFAFLG